MLMSSSSSSSSTSKNSTTVRTNSQLRLARAGVRAAFTVSSELGAATLVRLFSTPRRHERPTKELPMLSRGERFDVSVVRTAPYWSESPTTSVAAWRWGAGPTVLLVHGWEGRASQLGPLVSPLVDAGFSVVAFDAPGHGDSNGNRLYLPDFADAVAAVARATGGVHAVVAHSFGAAATLRAHALGELSCSRLVLVAPNTIVANAVAAFERTLELSQGERALFEAKLSADTGANLADLSVAELVGDAGTPLLVIHDEGDLEIPIVAGEQVVAAWPGAILERTTGLGHRRILRDDEVLARITEFVAMQQPSLGSEMAQALGKHWADDVDLSSMGD